MSPNVVRIMNEYNVIRFTAVLVGVTFLTDVTIFGLVKSYWAYHISIILSILIDISFTIYYFGVLTRKNHRAYKYKFYSHKFLVYLLPQIAFGVLANFAIEKYVKIEPLRVFLISLLFSVLIIPSKVYQFTETNFLEVMQKIRYDKEVNKGDNIEIESV